MSDSHFKRLAFLEKWGSIVVCRHGVVHLRWENVTIRLRVETFQQLASLVNEGSPLPAPFSFSDGDLCVATEEFDYRVTIRSVELLLAADAWLAFELLVADAADQLDQLLARDAWEDGPESVSFDFDPQELMCSHRFSLN